jgi:hypothetical protein
VVEDQEVHSVANFSPVKLNDEMKPEVEFPIEAIYQK